MNAVYRSLTIVNILSKAFLTPANAMIVVELTKLAGVLEGVGLFSNISTLARNVSERVTNAIWKSTVRPFYSLNQVHSSSENRLRITFSHMRPMVRILASSFLQLSSVAPSGLGSRYVMDDANVPVRPPSHLCSSFVIHCACQSLLSLPYLGFLGKPFNYTNHGKELDS